MSALQIITEARSAGVVLRLEGDKLRYDAPPSAMTPNLRDALRTHRHELIALLTAERYGLTVAQLVEAAGPDWADIVGDSRQLEALAVMLRDMARRKRGQVPQGWTAVAECRGCGPVWLFHGTGKKLDGCPWCFNRVDGLPIPRPSEVRCRECTHWTPVSINPPEGLGSCAIGDRDDDREIDRLILARAGV